MSQNNVVGWFEIYVEDMERAVMFYETVLEKKLGVMSDPTNSGMQMRDFPGDMTGYGANGALVKMEGFGPSTGGTLVYFAVEDCAAEEARVVSAGGEIIKTKESLGEFGWMSLVKDTEGNIIGLHSME